MNLRAALALTLLLAPIRPFPAEPAAAELAAVEPAPEQAEPGTFQAPPAAASKADADLWRKARDVNVSLPVERGVSTRLQAQVSGGGWADRLPEAVRRGTLGEERAAKLRQALLERWSDLARLLSSRWPVDPARVCGYPWLDFDSTLRTEDAAFRARELPPARGRLVECVANAEAVLAALRHANHEYREASEDVDRAAPALPPAVAAQQAADR